MASDQEVLDEVVTHLRAQGEKAMDPTTLGCKYRSVKKDGTILKCAAGCLIKDEEYKPEMERKGIVEVVSRYGLTHLAANVRLLGELQAVHDRYPFERWEAMFAIVAKEFNLKLKEVNG